MESRVGAVTLAVLGVGLALILGLGNQHLRPGIRVEVTVARTGPLKVGAPVRLAGLTLGSVDGIHLESGPLAVLEVWLDRRHTWLVPATSDLFIAQSGLLGDAYLEVAPRLGPTLEDGMRLRGVDPPPIDHLLAASYENLEAVNAFLRDGLPSVKKLGRALDGLETTMTTLIPPGDALAAWQAGVRLRAELAPVGIGPLPRLSLPDPGLAPRLERLSALLHGFPPGTDARIDRLTAALGRVAPILAKLEAIRDGAADLTAYVASGRGTLGALVSDVELADVMKEMTKRMKREPWRALGKEEKKKTD